MPAVGGATSDADPGVRWLGPPAKPMKAHRVVTLAPSLTATVLALGEQRSLVGVSRYDDAPEVKSLRRVGGFNDPSVEAVVALRPTLVIAQMAPSNQRPVEAMARLGIRVLAVRLSTVADVEAAILAVGEALGRGADAKTTVDGLEATRAKVRAQAKGQPLKALFVYGFTPLVVAGPTSFAGELLNDLGVQNLAADATTAYPSYSLEKVSALGPQVVIDASDASEGREAFKRVPALAKARWVTLPSKRLLQPGPELGLGLEELAAALRPADAGR